MGNRKLTKTTIITLRRLIKRTDLIMEQDRERVQVTRNTTSMAA